MNVCNSPYTSHSNKHETQNTAIDNNEETKGHAAREDQTHFPVGSRTMVCEEGTPATATPPTAVAAP